VAAEARRDLGRPARTRPPGGARGKGGGQTLGENRQPAGDPDRRVGRRQHSLEPQGAAPGKRVAGDGGPRRAGRDPGLHRRLRAGQCAGRCPGVRGFPARGRLAEDPAPGRVGGGSHRGSRRRTGRARPWTALHELCPVEPIVGLLHRCCRDGAGARGRARAVGLGRRCHGEASQARPPGTGRAAAAGRGDPDRGSGYRVGVHHLARGDPVLARVAGGRCGQSSLGGRGHAEDNRAGRPQGPTPAGDRRRRTTINLSAQRTYGRRWA